MNSARKISTPAEVSSDPWMTISQAAKEAEVSRNTIYAWCTSGRVEWKRIADRTVVSRASIDRVKRARAAAAAAEAAVLAGDA